MNGSAFDDPWGRPQSDGPALRAMALTHFANLLIKEGQREYVTLHLFDHKTPSDSVIKADLDYIASSWRKNGFDIWEETQGQHFYTMMVQRRALIEGATLAQDLGDHLSSATYLAEAKALSETLESFWDTKKGFIIESQNQVATHPKTGLIQP